jgi:hypothetical protein
MSSEDRRWVSYDQKSVDHLEGPLKAAREALCQAENALAVTVLAMAEADCKGGRKPVRRLREIRLAYCEAVRTLDNLRTTLPSRPGRHTKKVGAKRVHDFL